MKQKSFFGCVLAALFLAGISLFGLSACSKSGKCTMEKDGGVSIQMQMCVSEALDALTDYNTTPAYKNALAVAKQMSRTGESRDFLEAFFEAYEAEGYPLASLFCSYTMRDKVNRRMSDEQVEQVVRNEIDDILYNSVNVLRTRLERRGVQANVRIVGSDRITVEFPGKEEGWPYYRLLQSRGGLEFWETYYTSEIEDALAQLKLEELMLIPVNRYLTPVVVRASYADTARVNAYLSSPFAQSVLPSDIRFAWSHKAVDEQGMYFELIALKARPDGRAALEGDVVTEVKAAPYEYHETIAEISIKMNEEGARVWQRVTKENIGRVIAMVVDGDVYSYPTVQSEIKGGRSSIMGSYTLEEAQELADILQSGMMPCRFIIIQEDYIRPTK